MELILTRLPGKSGRIQVEKRDGGKLMGRDASAFQSAKQFDDAADALGLDATDLMEHVDAFQRGTEDSTTVQLATAVAGPYTVKVRGRMESDGAAVGHVADEPLAALRAAIAATPGVAEPVIYWQDTERLAALDVDYHAVEYSARPDAAAHELFVARISPRPSLSWQTHGRGHRLIYVSQGDFNASELCAAAALHVAGIDPTVRCEIKKITRHPGVALPSGRSCGPVQEHTQTSEMATLAGWINRLEVCDDDVQEYLTSRGLEIGKRYEHEHCPIQPHDPANRTPVVVGETSIFCHACSGRGITYGHRTPGLFTYSALIGSPVPTVLRACLQNLSHWSHSRFVVMEGGVMSEDVARAAYAAALKLCHGNDPRIPRVFHAGANFLRFDRRWVTDRGETYTKDVAPILATLPACQFVAKNGAVKPNPEMVARFEQLTDLTRHGYPALTPIWGLRMYSHRLTLRDPTKIPIVMHTRELSSESVAEFRPRYLVPENRPVSEEEAWEVLEGPFPRINRQAVKLIIAAKGVAEGEIGLPPMIFLRGPTAAAKTSTVMIAAAMTGDRNLAVNWTTNPERVRQSLQEAKEQGSYVTFNEIIKTSRQGGKNPEEALNFLLNLTPDSLSHKLFVGPVLLGALPVVCLTDTALPTEIIQHAQLARRIVGVSMPREMREWEGTIRETGIGKLEHLRLADPRYAQACDVILSVVMDTYFQHPMTFEEIAADLGFTRLEKMDAAREKDDTLVRFFRHVCAAQPAQGIDARRWSGRGWKVISREQQTDLSDLWRQICDEGQTTSEKCNERDWGQLLGVPAEVKCEIRNHGGKVAVRFIQYTTQKEYNVNEELLPPSSGVFGVPDCPGDGVSSVATEPAPNAAGAFAGIATLLEGCA